jgi:hypothetical protein
LHTRLGGPTDGARQGAWPRDLAAATGSTKAGHGEHREGHGREREVGDGLPLTAMNYRGSANFGGVATQRLNGGLDWFGHGERAQRRAWQEARRVGMERGKGELTMSERRAGPGKLQASSGLHTMR